MSRTGKIARLPQPLREELNHRLENGEPGNDLVDWLNTLPEVNALLATHFENRPISEQNLSDWKRGGFVEWQLHRDILYGASACAEDSAAYAVCGVSAKHFLAILNAHFASSLQAWDGTPDGPPHRTMRLLKYLYATVLSLRRSEQQDERLALDRERLEFTREKQSSRPRGQAASTPSTSAHIPTETPPATPPAQPPPDSLHQPPPILSPQQETHPFNPTQTPLEPSLKGAPSIPSQQNPTPAPANSMQNLDPNSGLSKPAAPQPQHPTSQHPATHHQPVSHQSAPTSPVQPTVQHPGPTSSSPAIPIDFDWSQADWTAYDYPG